MGYTPKELSGVLFYWSKDEEEKVKLDWERTRVQTYFLMNVNLSSKARVTYKKFKKDFWPFAWDNEGKIEREDPTEGMMSVEAWEELILKPAEGKEMDASEVVDI